MSKLIGFKGSVALSLTAAALLLSSLALPLWQLRMEAPQYREEEALKVAVYPGSLRGDLPEITVLNQYIGVHIPSHLPELSWMPGVLAAAAGLGVLSHLGRGRGRTLALALIPILLASSLLLAALQARQQMFEIGHHRDQKTKLVGVKDFTPPFIGHARVAQFDISSRFGIGAYLIAAAITLQLTAAWISRGWSSRRCSAGSVLEPSVTAAPTETGRGNKAHAVTQNTVNHHSLFSYNTR